jgi:GrpB-like predicted nucleotidyltransferase (UPF0157 family)
MDAVADDLACAGWQRQDGAHAFPLERPMLRAALDYQGERFQAHLHLIPAGSPELHDNRSFRDWLAADAALRTRYEAYKRAVLAAGIREGNAYAEAKSTFVVAALRVLGLRD